MTSDRVVATADLVEAHALAVVIHERIRELWVRREWYRQHVGWLLEQHQEDRHELRQLTRLARRARATSRPVQARVDVVAPAADGWAATHDWTEAELAYAAGR